MPISDYNSFKVLLEDAGCGRFLGKRGLRNRYEPVYKTLACFGNLFDARWEPRHNDEMLTRLEERYVEEYVNSVPFDPLSLIDTPEFAEYIRTYTSGKNVSGLDLRVVQKVSLVYLKLIFAADLSRERNAVPLLIAYYAISPSEWAAVERVVTHVR